MAQDTTNVKITVIAPDKWERKVAPLREKGERLVKEMRRQGKPFKAAVLAPKEVPSGAEVTMCGVVIRRDWKTATKLELVEEANNFLTKARLIGIFHPDILGALKGLLEEEPLPMYMVGEFFVLYGRFEQKYGTTSSQETMEKMEEFVKGKKEHLKDYEYKGLKAVPLPFAARHIMAHIGTDTKNRLWVKELKDATDLLHKWLHDNPA